MRHKRRIQTNWIFHGETDTFMNPLQFCGFSQYYTVSLLIVVGSIIISPGQQRLQNPGFKAWNSTGWVGFLLLSWQSKVRPVLETILGIALTRLEQMTPQNEAICISIYMHNVWLNYSVHNTAQIREFHTMAPIHAPASDLPMSEFRVKNMPHFVHSFPIFIKLKRLLVGVVSLGYSAEGKVHYLYRWPMQLLMFMIKPSPTSTW